MVKKTESNMSIKVKATFQGSALKPTNEIGLKEGEEAQIVVEKSAVDKFHGMTKISKKLADDIIEMEMWYGLIFLAPANVFANVI